MQATEAPPIETTPTEVFYEGFASESTKLLLLTIGGGAWFTGFFFMPASLLAGLGLAIVGLFTTGAAGYSLRKSGHSLPSATRSLFGDLAEILEDCSGGAAVAARDHILAPVALKAEQLAKRTGVLTETELNAIENGASPDLVRAMDHVFELIVGIRGNGTNCAILAGSLAGKTTFLHGVTYHLATRPDKKYLMIGDYNLGKDNGGGVPQWLGLPIYDRAKHQSPVGNFVFGPADIIVAINRLLAIYQERIQINADRAKAKQPPIKFIPIYFFCDEFQSFMGSCSADDRKSVGKIAGDLARARGLMIFFFPILHEDKAEGFLDRSELGKLNLLVLGSLVGKLDFAPELYNSQVARRFDPEAVAQVAPIRRELEREWGKDASIRALAFLSLKHPIIASDGTQFGDGCHLLCLPNCTKVLAQEWDWPEDIKLQVAPDQDVETYFAARQSEPLPSLVIYSEEAEDFSDLAGALRSIVIDNYQSFAAAAKVGKVSRTKFFDTCSRLGFGRNRNKKDRHYRFVCTIADQFPDKLINLGELLSLMDGGGDD